MITVKYRSWLNAAPPRLSGEAITERLEETLILKRSPDAKYTEGYIVLFEGRCVGRIYQAVFHAPREAPCSGVSIFLSGRAAMVRSTATPRL